jgi:hypothetical protein
MLTKRQLEDAAECLTRFHERTCGQCSCNKFRYGYVGSYGCTENAAQTAMAYREMLEEVIKHLSHCPFCKINRPWLYKHKDGCKLAALLKESEGEEG